MPDLGNIPILSVKSISTNKEQPSGWKAIGGLAAAILASHVKGGSK